jgi:hypothetical protein
LEIVFEDEMKAKQSPLDCMSASIRDSEDDDHGYDLTDATWFATVPNPRKDDNLEKDGVIFLVEEGQFLASMSDWRF